MRKRLGVAVVVGVLALSGRGALGAEEARVQAASGTVVAVTPASKTIVVEATLGGQPWIIGAEVTDQTKFEGKAKRLGDVKPRDKVTLRWVREEHRLAVRSVTVR